MPEFVMTVGISGSGKSRWCYNQHNIATDIVADSDEIRRELWGDANDQQNPNKVFNEMFSRAKSALSNGHNVFYCATNLTMKYRIHTLNQIKRRFPDVRCRVVVFNTPLFICKEWNKKRDRQVPEWLFARQACSFQPPVESEGWDAIEVITPASYDVVSISNRMWEDVDAAGSQDNPHHTLTLRQHLNKTIEVVENDKLSMEQFFNVLCAAATHDIGKAYTRTYDENGIAHYYGHEGYGSYLAMNLKLPYRSVQLIAYHMYPYNQQAASVWEKRLGEQLWYEISILNRADKLAH